MTCVMWLSDTLLGYCMWLPDIFAGLQHCVAVSSASSGLWPVWCGFQMPLLGCNIMLPYQMFFVAFRCLCWVTAWVAWASCVAQWPLKPLLLPSSHTSTCSTSGLLRLQVCAVHSFQSPRSYAGELGQQITKHSSGFEPATSWTPEVQYNHPVNWNLSSLNLPQFKRIPNAVQYAKLIVD